MFSLELEKEDMPDQEQDRNEEEMPAILLGQPLVFFLMRALFRRLLPMDRLVITTFLWHKKCNHTPVQGSL